MGNHETAIRKIQRFVIEFDDEDAYNMLEMFRTASNADYKYSELADKLHVQLTELL